MSRPSGWPDRAELEARIGEVSARLRRAAEKVGRDASTIRVVAVAKTFPTDVVLAAIDAGVTDIGENRAQELKEKVAVVGDRARWHFVGHLQSNKVRHVAGVAELVHSVDRLALAEAIALRSRRLGRAQDVLIEVNISGEASKNGVEPERAVPLAEEIARLEGIEVKGLMTMPPMVSDPAGARPHFRALAELGGRLAQKLPRATELSMGMSRDFDVAVEEGATIVRVGEAIFGPRPA